MYLKIKNFTIKTKLILALLVVGVVPMVVTGILLYSEAKDSLEKEAFSKLEGLDAVKDIQMKSFFENVGNKAEIFASMPFISKAVKNLDDLSKEAGENGFTGKRILQYPPYRKEYNKYHEFVKRYNRVNGFKNTILFSPNSGRLLLSAEMNDDFGSEMRNAKTHLAESWRLMRDVKKRKITDLLPYAPLNNEFAMFVIEPAFIEGDYIGSIGFQIPREILNKIVNERTGLGRTGESYLVGLDTDNTSSLRTDRVIKGEKVGQKKTDSLIKKCLLEGKGGAEYKIGSTGDRELVVYDILEIQGLKWGMFTTMSQEEINEPAAAMLNTVLIILLVSAGLIVLFAFGLALSINRGIQGVLTQLGSIINNILEGKLNTRGDAELVLIDFKEIVNQINNLIEEFVRPLKMMSQYLDQLSKGDIPTQITDDYKGDFNDLKKNVNDMIVNLTRFAVDVQTAAGQVATGSEELSSASEEMSQSANEQASNIEEVSSSMEEMSSSVVQNSDNSKQTAAISDKAAGDAQEGGKAVIETVKAMKSIAEKINIIEEIARQTNLLALNAAIEAARAGEHGKGFAVVAGEVRDLAARSGDAAREIGELSGSSVEIAERAGNLIEEIVPQIRKTADLVQEINVSSNEQAEGIEQVTRAIQQLDNGIQQNASATEQMASTSEELSGQAGQLQTVASFFKIDKSLVDRNREAKITHAAREQIAGPEAPRARAQKKVIAQKAEADTIMVEGDPKGANIEMNDEYDDEFERY